MRKGLRWGITGVLALCLLMLCVIVAHAETFEGQYGLYPDFAANLRVQYIGHRLASAAELPTVSFKIFNDRSLNALALPDGRVYVTSMMATAVTDDELAFVLGHELTHIKEKHAQDQAQRATGGAILGAIIVGVLGGSNSDIRMGADIAGGLTLGHYSRKDEYAADAGGIRLMARSGYDPKRAADAMQRLIDLYGRGDAKVPVLGWFATHPDTENRKQRLLDTAAEYAKAPLPTLPPPTGIAITLDQSAEHARSWAHGYLSVLLAESGAGRVVVLPSAQYPLPVMVLPPEEEKTEEKKDEKKPEPLKQVVVNIPTVPAGYTATLFLRQIPAGRAATIEEGQGTAVEARLQWKQLSTGFTGECVAIAQNRKQIPWHATEELQDPNKAFELFDGKDTNIEGTLEGTATRRASMAFAEILEADAPVDHSAPVTISITTGKLRPGDYIYVVRGSMIVAEVCVDEIVSKKKVRGTVLWGTHTWKKKDRFVAAD